MKKFNQEPNKDKNQVKAEPEKLIDQNPKKRVVLKKTRKRMPKPRPYYETAPVPSYKPVPVPESQSTNENMPAYDYNAQPQLRPKQTNDIQRME